MEQEHIFNHFFYVIFVAIKLLNACLNLNKEEKHNIKSKIVSNSSEAD